MFYSFLLLQSREGTIVTTHQFAAVYYFNTCHVLRLEAALLVITEDMYQEYLLPNN